MNIKTNHKHFLIFLYVIAAVLVLSLAIAISPLSLIPDRPARYVVSHCTLSEAERDFYDFYIKYINPYIVPTDGSSPLVEHRKDTLAERTEDIGLIYSTVFSNLGTRFKGIICVEAGNELNAETLSAAAGESVTPVTKLSSIPTDDIGYYKILLECRGKQRSCLLIITDPAAPVIKAEPKTLWVGGDPDIKDFIVSAEDSTVLEYYYVTEPECGEEGKTEFTIAAKDRGGNVWTETLECEVKVDNEPPVISGAKDKLCYIGDNVMYKEGVTVTDNRDGSNVPLEVDISKVDPYTEGSYPVKYTATDSSGLTTTVSVTYTFEYTREEALINKANELAALVIEKIVRDGMTDRQKAKVIYGWVTANIDYAYNSNKDSWYEGAIEGFTKRKGDCFTFAAVSKALFTAAGIENVVVSREETPKRPNTHHYWNMVKIDGEWYHIDATPRVDRQVFFLVTTDYLLRFSEDHRDSHLFDPSKYPKTP